MCQERPWSSPVMATILQAAVNNPYSDRLKAVLSMAPRLLDVYFSIALRDVNDCKFCLYILNACLTWHQWIILRILLWIYIHDLAVYSYFSHSFKHFQLWSVHWFPCLCQDLLHYFRTKYFLMRYWLYLVISICQNCCWELHLKMHVAVLKSLCRPIIYYSNLSIF